MQTLVLIMLGHVAIAMLLAWWFFALYTLARPPIGVFGLADVAVLMVGIVVVPLLYLILPQWIVVLLLGSAVLSLLTMMFGAVIRRRGLVWSIALLLVGVDIGVAYGAGTHTTAFYLVNNGVLVLMTVGITNLWVQGGMKAREITLLGVGLTVYDYAATTASPLMAAMFDRLSGLPFSPMISWQVGAGLVGGIGLGDVLLATIFPLVMWKAFSRTAGVIAAGLALLALAGIFSLLSNDRVFPAMVVLGPSMLAQYLFWRWRCGPERTTQQFRAVLGAQVSMP